MTQEDIIRMAREAEIGDSHGYIIANELAHLERFAALVAAAENEACAKLYAELAENAKDAMALRFQQIAYAIRARGQA